MIPGMKRMKPVWVNSIMQPRFSVMIPVRNGSRSIGKTIASALAQEESDMEIVVVDNASTDTTADVVLGFRDPRIRYIRNPHELEMVGNWNRCVELARGEFVTLLHHDDRWLSGFVARARRLFDAHPEAGVIYGGCRIVDMKGQLLRLHQPFSEPHVWSGGRELEVLMHGNYIYCPTVVYRASALRGVSGFTLGLTLTPDWEMLLRLALAGSIFIYDPEPLSEYYERGDSLHATLERNLRTGEEHIAALLNIAGQVTRAGQTVQAAHAGTLNAWATWEIDVALREFKNLRVRRAAHHLVLAWRATGGLFPLVRKGYLSVKKRAKLWIQSRRVKTGSDHFCCC